MAKTPAKKASLYPARVPARTSLAVAATQRAKIVTVAGRVMERDEDSFRLMDESGSLVIAPKGKMPALFSLVLVSGIVRFTDNNEPFLAADSVKMLAPALREPTTEKQWERLLHSGSVKTVLTHRMKFFSAIRSFFSQRDFLEADTPSLVGVPGMEPYLSPFATQVHTPDKQVANAYLATSPEYALKKLLVAGVERVFELSRSFRDEESFGGLHNSEFVMLEWYRAYASYLDIMDDCEALFPFVAQAVTGKTTITFRGSRVRLDAPWQRLTVTDAFQQYAGIDLEKNLTRDTLRRTLVAKGYRPAESDTYDDLFFRVFLQEIEPCLGQQVPTILYNYPVQMAALAKRSEKDPRFAERFEVYVAGVELANAYTELNDPVEQEERLHEEYALRKKLKKPLFGPDQDFIDALATGMPPAGGIALGADRLLQVLLGEESLDDVRLFPASEQFVFEKKEGKKKGVR